MKKTPKKFNLPLTLLFIFLIHLPFVFAKSKPVSAVAINTSAKGSEANTNNISYVLYDSLQLESLGLTKQAFIEGVKGYEILRSSGKLNNDNILTIADFSLPSSLKRLFVIDIENLKVLYNTYVAHGRNSGKEYANRFSNAPNSNMSSLGFYVTGNTYHGEHGLSLRLEGEEQGFNDNAKNRAIVIHCADYVSERMIETLGYIGRSLGCPALPKRYSKPIIETIKNGSCFFIYSPSQRYLTRSPLLKQAS
ncbi:MAG: murein L,D-transpeptidase catalytic domain family protein [Ginsengibacter sp.]